MAANSLLHRLIWLLVLVNLAFTFPVSFLDGRSRYSSCIGDLCRNVLTAEAQPGAGSDIGALYTNLDRRDESTSFVEDGGSIIPGHLRNMRNSVWGNAATAGPEQVPTGKGFAPAETKTDNDVLGNVRTVVSPPVPAWYKRIWNRITDYGSRVRDYLNLGEHWNSFRNYLSRTGKFFGDTLQSGKERVVNAWKSGKDHLYSAWQSGKEKVTGAYDSGKTGTANTWDDAKKRFGLYWNGPNHQPLPGQYEDAKNEIFIGIGDENTPLITDRLKSVVTGLEGVEVSQQEAEELAEGFIQSEMALVEPAPQEAQADSPGALLATPPRDDVPWNTLKDILSDEAGADYVRRSMLLRINNKDGDSTPTEEEAAKLETFIEAIEKAYPHIKNYPEEKQISSETFQRIYDFRKQHEDAYARRKELADLGIQVHKPVDWDYDNSRLGTEKTYADHRDTSRVVPLTADNLVEHTAHQAAIQNLLKKKEGKKPASPFLDFVSRVARKAEKTIGAVTGVRPFDVNDHRSGGSFRSMGLIEGLHAAARDGLGVNCGKNPFLPECQEYREEYYADIEGAVGDLFVG